MKAYMETMNLLKTLKLKGITNNLDELISEAEAQKFSYIGLINALLRVEVQERAERKLSRNMAGAHFPIEKRFDDYDFGKIKGIARSEAVNLLDCRWVDKRENMLFFGPPGIGKTHLAIAFGINAVEKGYTVSFEKATNLMKLLRTANIQRKAAFRIKKILSSNVFILDEIGYTPIDKAEANLFFNLISELYEKASIIITSNKGFDQWAEMMGDSIMTTALLDRLLHHARFFNLDGESYRMKNILSKKEV